MRRLLVGLLAAATFAVPTIATAAPTTTYGSFVSSTIRDGQPHRVYFVVTAGHGAKTCDVTLRAKTTQVDLGTDRVGSGVLFYLRTANATKALAQAQAAPSPTDRIVCGH